MTWFLVTWIAYACPGGWFGGLVPAPARPFVCRPTTAREAYDRLERAQARVAALGEPAAPALTEIRGLRLKDRSVTWTSEVHF